MSNQQKWSHLLTWNKLSDLLDEVKEGSFAKLDDYQGLKLQILIPTGSGWTTKGYAQIGIDEKGTLQLKNLNGKKIVTDLSSCALRVLNPEHYPVFANLGEPTRFCEQALHQQLLSKRRRGLEVFSNKPKNPVVLLQTYQKKDLQP